MKLTKARLNQTGQGNTEWLEFIGGFRLRTAR